jgi:two-component system sensor histidine kinase ChvG
VHDTVKETGVTAPAVLLGDDWGGQGDAGSARPKRNFRLLRSPLTSKIVIFNLIALNILVGGILLLSQSREGLLLQHAKGLVAQAGLVSNQFESPPAGALGLGTATETGAKSGDTAATLDHAQVQPILDRLTLRQGLVVFVFDAQGKLAGFVRGNHANTAFVGDIKAEIPDTGILRMVHVGWEKTSAMLGGTNAPPMLEQRLEELVPLTLAEGTQFDSSFDDEGSRVYLALAQIVIDGVPVGAVAISSPSGEIDALARSEKERVIQLFVVAIIVSIGLSFVLASTIAKPLADLTSAAEAGQERGENSVLSGRVRIPDLSARPDEIGRLSLALRGMTSALYGRIDANEQFAADVSHEIKNPLASLQSAVGTLRVVKRDDQRERLLEVIEHDVRRLDRLVSDISNASRLDAELVKETKEVFDLKKMLFNIGQFVSEDARKNGIEFIINLPEHPVPMSGLEERLAQVFVNLLSNAVSFCGDGDAIRIWTRKRDRHVLIVVEDTGPGIPDQALSKIFTRFYSQRPEAHFGNNSGLGLAISKQIVDAHGGLIWAENIRREKDAVGSGPVGARFVVGLPI